MWRERFAALLDIVRACRSDLVALQEVTPRHLEHLLTVEWVRREFRISDITGSTLQPHGVLLLSRLPLRNPGLQELPGNKNRKMLVAELGLGSRSVGVGNLHLESSPQATPVRLAQLDTILPRLPDKQHTLLLGDFNFDPVQLPEQSRVDQCFLDLWTELRPAEPGYTEDTAVNGMLLSHKGREKQVRFDRILLRSPRPGWIPESVQLIGTRAITPQLPGLFPSDHFGLAGSLVWSDSDDHSGNG
jgi:endonuclease/exonuclease/phosphatase family metal-dependent hydrolase